MVAATTDIRTDSSHTAKRRGAQGVQPELLLRSLPELVEGTDLDPHAVWLASIVLAAECLPVLARVPEHRREPLPALAHVADGLADPERPARVVLMNPPYGRVKLEASERERFAHILYGHANLYVLFVGHHTGHLEPGGVLAALVPTSFTSGAYSSNLRAHLAAEAALREVAFVSDRAGVFAGVLQETCLATFTASPCRFVRVGHINGALTQVAKVAPVPAVGPWLLPRRPMDAEVAARAALLPATLGTSGWSASTGPLVWNRRKADLHPRPSKRRVPVLWVGDLDGGTLRADPSRDGQRYMTIRDGADAKTMCLTGPAVLVQRTTAPEQAQRLVSVELTDERLAAWGGTVVAENHLNVLRPVAGETPALSRSLLARLLASAELDRVLRCISGSVAVSAFELEALPLPDADTLSAWENLDEAALAAALHETYGHL